VRFPNTSRRAKRSGHASSALFFTARARRRGVRAGCPRSRHRKSPALITRARGTPDAGCVRSLACKSEKHTSEVTTKAPDTSGVPHAVVFSACFVLSPANTRRLSPSSPRYVTCARSEAGRGGPDSVRDHTTWADAQRRCRWGESPPRSAPRSVVVSRWFAPHASPSPRAPFVQGMRLAGLRPDTPPSVRRCRVHRIPPRD
jgi:hypothetical protein